jgi:Mrp family chromosome partitioning ATPase
VNDDQDHRQLLKRIPIGSERDGAPREVVRKGKTILYHETPSPSLDSSVVTVQRYGCFGAHLFPAKSAHVQLTAGVTSCRPREGKTLVAANMAAFFATEAREDALIVDLSFRRPRLHHIFGVPSSPGIQESLRTDTVMVYRTSIRHLWMLPLGFSDYGPMTFDRIVELRDTLNALKSRFRFIVLDLPAALQADFPGMVSGHLDGYFLVVMKGRTKSTDVRHVLQVLGEQKVLGFVMNRNRG